MGIASTAHRIRNSRQATVGAFGSILLAQTPVMLWFSRSVDLQYPFAGVVGAWCVGATVWVVYTMAHLLAPIAEIQSHPQSESWGPIQTINVYTYLATLRSGTRLVYGVLGFVVALYGILIFLILNQLLLILPVTVGLLASILMVPNRESMRPADEISVHFE